LVDSCFAEENKKQKQTWGDIDIYRNNKATRTMKEKKELEKFILENMKISLDKLK
jgi:hypothetical protein